MNRNVEDIKNIGEEVINQDELKNLLEKKEKLLHMMVLNLQVECI